MVPQQTSLARKCVKTLRQEGLTAFCAKATRRVGESLFTTNSADWYCADLSLPPPSVYTPAAASVDLDAWDEVCGWLAELRSIFRWVYVEAELQAARDFGHLFPLLRLRQSKAGYMKVGFRQAYVTDFEEEISIPSGSAFVYDTFIHPDHRARGLATFMISQMLESLRQRGLQYVWCHIPRWNVASRRAFAKNGFVRTKHIRYFRLCRYGFRTYDPQRLMCRDGTLSHPPDSAAVK